MYISSIYSSLSNIQQWPSYKNWWHLYKKHEPGYNVCGAGHLCTTRWCKSCVQHGGADHVRTTQWCRSYVYNTMVQIMCVQHCGTGHVYNTVVQIICTTRWCRSCAYNTVVQVMCVQHDGADHVCTTRWCRWSSVYNTVVQIMCTTLWCRWCVLWYSPYRWSSVYNTVVQMIICVQHGVQIYVWHSGTSHWCLCDTVARVTGAYVWHSDTIVIRHWSWCLPPEPTYNYVPRSRIIIYILQLSLSLQDWRHPLRMAFVDPATFTVTC